MNILAAISFADPLMLAGLLAAGIPLALHLLNRIRSPVVPFPTLRFLKITAQKTSRRRQVQQYFLLLVRMAVFAMIAMAVAHPLIRGGSATLAYGLIALLLGALALLVLGAAWATAAIDRAKAATPASPQSATAPSRARRDGLISIAALVLALLTAGYALFGLTSGAYFSGDSGEFSGRSTACVIIVDNSHSMLATQNDHTHLDAARQQVHHLLVDAIRPAQAAILPTNPGTGPANASLTSDMTSLIGSVDQLPSLGKALPMKERIRAAAELLAGSSEAGKMLIILSDFARPAYADAEVFAALKDSPINKDVQIVLMPVAAGTPPAPPADAGIVSFALAEGSTAPVVGSETIFDAELLNNADAADVKDLELLVDEQPVEGIAPRVQLGPAGVGSARTTIHIPYRPTTAGPHVFTLRFKDTADAMEWDNSRSLVLTIADQVRVLVVGDAPTAAGPRPRSAAFYFSAALAPFAGTDLRDPTGKPIAWSIKPTYRAADDIPDAAALNTFAAIFLCDIPHVTAKLADALTRYLHAGDHGGRLIWVLGPSVDAAQYNGLLLPRDLLPGQLQQPLVSATGSTIDWVDLQSDLFANLFDNQEPFRSIVITGRWSIAAPKGRPLSKLADGTLLLNQHSGPGGVGDIYTLLTSPAANWSNLGATVLLVPMASRMALGDSAHAHTQTSIDTGDGYLLPIANADRRMNNLTIDVTTPEHAVLNVRPTVAPGSPDTPHWYFDKTLTPGIYRWRSVDNSQSGLFAANPPADEVDLLPADPAELAREIKTARPAIVAPTADDLLAHLQKQSEGTSLAPGVLAMVLILAVLEALMANRHRPAAPFPTATPAAPAPSPEPQPA